MNDADKNASEDWKVSTPEIKYKFENGSLLQEMIAGEAWQAACEWRDSQNTLWRNAAIRVGEDLHSVGPNGYYNMSAEEWLNWALRTICSKPNSAPLAAQINQQLVEALDKLHAVVIAKNRAGADWGDQFTDLMVALSLAQSALNAAKSGDV